MVNDSKKMIILSLVTIILLSGLLSLLYISNIVFYTKSSNLNFQRIYNKDLDIYIKYPIKGYWTAPTNISGPLIKVYHEKFYRNGEEINLTLKVFEDVSGISIAYDALEVSPGDVIDVVINLTLDEPLSTNVDVYVFIDLAIDIPNIEYYINNNITLLVAKRGYIYREIPYNIVLMSSPGYILLEPKKSTIVILSFRILESSPLGEFPISLYRDVFILWNNSLYWLGSVEHPIFLIVRE